MYAWAATRLPLSMQLLCAVGLLLHLLGFLRERACPRIHIYKRRVTRETGRKSEGGGKFPLFQVRDGRDGWYYVESLPRDDSLFLWAAEGMW